MSSESKFVVGLTADFYNEQGELKYTDIGLDLLEASPAIEITRIDRHAPEIGASQIAHMNGVIVLTPTVSAQTLENSANLLAVSRFGVGYDGVDVAACTNSDVMLLITTGAVDHSVAEATVGWMLALSHHIRIKDRLVRTGEWHVRSHWMGSELRDRTLGIIGFGGIGRAVLHMTQGFGMKPPLIFDPFVATDMITAAGGRSVSLDELLFQADFVSLHCPLNDKTRDLLSTRELALMKPTAFLINTARGGIVNEDALFKALSEKQIGGAALDCFLNEPLLTPPTFATLDNVLLAPHSIAWTHELFREIGRTACRGLLDLAHRRTPHGIVNTEVLERSSFQEKWKRLSVG
ncbi:MAG: NAD(P)-dependent oxidoreductase [Planctomycetota bacterium]|nr:NAD(P)-dependent oxidoreductase [Planctomycetota bacterium]MDA1178341.1 NAD(P)-dependent oxidoreductase [Planctomycetota bacterium]